METLTFEIKSRYDELTETAQEILKACTAILCTDGVNIRHLCDIIDNGNQCFRHELDKLLNCGLLIENFNRVQVHNEVIAVLSNKKLSVEVLNSIIENLTKNTTPSFNDDLLQVKDYFTMGMNILKFVVQEKPSQINYEYFANLAVNLTQLYEVFAVPDLLVNDVKDLPLMQGIELARSRTHDNSMLYAALITCRAYVLLNGFHYEESKHLLDKAINSSHDNKEFLAYSMLVYALWWENYGCFGNCLAFAYRAWDTSTDQCFRNYIASYIAYTLALCEEHGACNDWLERVEENKFVLSDVGIYYQLAYALYNKNNDQLSLKHLRVAEEFINQINCRSPLKARFLFVKSVILDDGFNLLREANICYREYAELYTQLYLGTNGAMYIYLAREASRLITIGATISAKQMINKLDSLQFHPGFALSVRICAALAYTEYFRTCGSEFFSLAEIYSQKGKELAERTRPTDEFNILQVYGGKTVPPSLSGEAATFGWEYQLLQNMIENREVSTNEIKDRIVYLQKLFPNHKKELEVISASLSDPYSAIKVWNRLILSTAGQKDKFDLILQIARTAMSKDLIWDANRYYELLLQTDGYKDLVAFNNYKRVDVLIEYAGCLEQCGMRGKAKGLWSQLEILAEGTSKLADVYQLHGNYAFDHEKWTEALECYNQCLEVIQPEDQLCDQRMTSILSFRSSCLGYMGHYQAAYDGILEAKRYFPQDEFDSGLEFNHAYFALALGKNEESRQIIAKAKNFLTDKEKESFDGLITLLNMNQVKREIEVS